MAVIKELSGILKPFYDTTARFKYPAYSLLVPLLKITFKIDLENSSNLKNIKKAIASDLEEQYCSIQVKRALLKAALLISRAWIFIQ